MDRPFIGGAALLVLSVALGWKRLIVYTCAVVGGVGVTAVILIVSNWKLARWLQRERSSAQRRLQARIGGRRMRYVTRRAYVAAIEEKKAEEQAVWREEEIHPKVTGEVAVVVDRIIRNVLRDFVLKWFDEIVPPSYTDSPDTYSSSTFPLAVERIIRHVLSAILLRLDRLDLSALVIGRILPLVTQHLEAYRLAEQELQGSKDSVPPGAGVGGGEEMDLLIARRHAVLLAKIKGPSAVPHLHPAVDVPTLNSQASEQSHLRSLVDQILPLVFPINEDASPAVHIVSREIVACAVFGPVVEALSDPDFYNRLIEEKAGQALKEQKMVEKFRQALEQQAAAAPSPRSSAAPIETPTGLPRSESNLSAMSTTKDFERFTRSISRCTSLFDARRIRNDLDSHIRRTETTLSEQSAAAPSDDLHHHHLRTFLDRLHQVRERADRRIAELGGSTTNPTFASPSASHLRPPIARAPRETLLAILQDSDSPALSYLTEFLDRRERTGVLGFWLAVEGLKDPLEDVSAGTFGPNGNQAKVGSGQATEAMRDDLLSIADVYFRNPAMTASLGLDPQSVSRFSEAARASGDEAGSPDVRDLRRALFEMQSSAFERLLADDYPAFAASELFLKATASMVSTQSLTSEPVAVASPIRPTSSGPIRPSSLPGMMRALSQDSHPPRDPAYLQHHPQPISTPVSRPGSPEPSLLTFKGGAAGAATRRTATAAPQVTLQAAFDERPPGQRLTGPATKQHNALLRPQGNRAQTSASFDFLMSPSDEGRAPLFGDDEDLSVAGSRRVSSELEPKIDTAMASALTDALTSIISTADDESPRPPTVSRMSSASPPSHVPAAAKRAAIKTGSPPAGSSKPSPAPSIRRGLFDDDEDDHSDAEASPSPPIDGSLVPAVVNIRTLPEAEDKASLLEGQLGILNGLMRKAELTGNRAEMRLLSKSMDAVTAELTQVAFRRSQLEARQAQESQHHLVPGRTTVSISGTTVGRSGATQFVLYLIEVHKLADDGSFASGWVVTRRYSEFSSLHTILRDKYPISRSLDFPAKTLTTNRALVEQRKLGLEKYLKALVHIPVLCQSSELSVFLSRSNVSLPAPDSLAGLRKQFEGLPGHSFVRSFYQTLSTSLSGPSLLEALITGLRQQAADFARVGGPAASDDILSSSMHLEKGSQDPLATLSATVQPIDGELVTAFTAPICDLIVEVFELNDKNQWLRKQGIVVLLQQILGSAIERKMREAVAQNLGPAQLVHLLTGFENVLWPGGELRPPSVPRTAEEKARTRDIAFRQLMVLMPDLAANVLGRSNARRGARRLFAVCQNQRLNRHLAYCIIDEVIRDVFPEIRV